MRTLQTVFQNPRLRQSIPSLIVLWISIAVAIINTGQSLVTAKCAATNSDVVLQTTTAQPLNGIFQSATNVYSDQVNSHLDRDLTSNSGDNFQGRGDSSRRSNSIEYETGAHSQKKLSTDKAAQQTNSANEIKTDLGWECRRCAL